jgi:hypothetical protein
MMFGGRGLVAFIAATCRSLPLAAASRRRRFLAAWLYHSAANAPPPAVSSVPEQDRRDSALGAAATSPAWVAHVPSPTAEPSGWERVWTALQQPASLTWMLAGESFDAAPPRLREWRTFTSRLTEAIRSHPLRSADVFIVDTRPGPALARLAQDLPLRVARFHPDIVLLSLSPGDVEQGLTALEAFEQQLAGVVEAVLAAESVPILCTPPCLGKADAETALDRSVYVEAIRATAAEYDIPLVDHWSEWESTLPASAVVSHTREAADLPPGPGGHARLAERILQELKLSSSAATAPLPAE